MKTIKDFDKNKTYKTPCGHKNAVVFNIWPFDLMACIDCGQHFTIYQLIIEK